MTQTPFESLTESSTHRAGFVHIIGEPNAGKSTLINGLLDYPLSIATHKPQTTRHNIVGLHNEKDLQIVYLDTPGDLTPTSELQEAMKRNVDRALVHSDVLLWVVDLRETEINQRFKKIQQQQPATTLVLLNKIDLLPADLVAEKQKQWQAALGDTAQIFLLSARHHTGLSALQKKIITLLPLHPPYYPKENLTDKSERFLVGDIIRKYIFLFYHKEIPYSTEVHVTDFKESDTLLRVDATLYVERRSQKGILIGHKGSALKKAGTAARKELEALYKKKIFLSLHIKVSPNWRSKTHQLTAWGYP